MQRSTNRESTSPMGAYEIWHREGDEFRRVGSLKAGNLLVAAEVTMSRSPDEWAQSPDNTRQTRTGDVIVSPDRAAFKVVGTEYGFTFEQTDFAQLRRDVDLHAELKQDFQMGQEEAARGDFREGMKMLGEVLGMPEPERETEREQ